MKNKSKALAGISLVAWPFVMLIGFAIYGGGWAVLLALVIVVLIVASMTAGLWLISKYL